mmetsp:Transcript_1860/g.4852  ORF Transcript_1860/g.4852 Transcript_1860/m.4852 type:complete len:202 (+) Transcript_1860:347-952(+)
MPDQRRNQQVPRRVVDELRRTARDPRRRHTLPSRFRRAIRVDRGFPEGTVRLRLAAPRRELRDRRGGDGLRVHRLPLRDDPRVRLLLHDGDRRSVQVLRLLREVQLEVRSGKPRGGQGDLPPDHHRRRDRSRRGGGIRRSGGRRDLRRRRTEPPPPRLGHRRPGRGSLPNDLLRTKRRDGCNGDGDGDPSEKKNEKRPRAS